MAAAFQALRGDRPGLAPWLLNSHAVELAGAVAGDVLLLDPKATPRSGDIVCAELRDYQRARTINIVRIFERAPPVDLLVARSLDAAAAPIVVDGERVTILGVFLPHRLRPAAA